MARAGWLNLAEIVQSQQGRKCHFVDKIRYCDVASNSCIAGLVNFSGAGGSYSAAGMGRLCSPISSKMVDSVKPPVVSRTRVTLSIVWFCQCQPWMPVKGAI